MALVMAAPLAAHASVSATPDKTARVNGTVYAIAQVGDRTIIGGAFTEVGDQPRNHLAAIRADGTVDPTFNPDVDGIVYAVTGNADGTAIYVGGTFSHVGGTPRANLAALGATGSVTDSWSADTTGDQPDVLGLAVNGSYLYVSGRFTGIDGTTTRKRLAALDPAGNLITTFNAAPTGTVRVVATAAGGTRLFAGGAFNAIGGQSRVGVAELNPLTGRALPFTATPVGSLLVAMGVSPSGDRLYYGTDDNRVFAYDTATNTKVWEMKNGGDTQAIAVGANEVYLGGHFGNNITDKVKRQWIESVNSSDGHVTAWDPKFAGGSLGVWAIVATPTALLVGGEFTTAAGQIQRRFARFSGTP
jgi:outer membrane protein assembly factor BamB